MNEARSVHWIPKQCDVMLHGAIGVLDDWRGGAAPASPRMPLPAGRWRLPARPARRRLCFRSDGRRGGCGRRRRHGPNGGYGRADMNGAAVAAAAACTAEWPTSEGMGHAAAAPPNAPATATTADDPPPRSPPSPPLAHAGAPVTRRPLCCGRGQRARVFGPTLRPRRLWLFSARRRRRCHHGRRRCVYGPRHWADTGSPPRPPSETRIRPSPRRPLTADDAYARIAARGGGGGAAECDGPPRWRCLWHRGGGHNLSPQQAVALTAGCRARVGPSVPAPRAAPDKQPGHLAVGDAASVWLVATDAPRPLVRHRRRTVGGQGALGVAGGGGGGGWGWRGVGAATPPHLASAVASAGRGQGAPPAAGQGAPLHGEQWSVQRRGTHKFSGHGSKQ